MKSLGLYFTLNESFTLHDFLTAHTVHLGNTGPPSYIDLANTDTIHYTIHSVPLQILSGK